MRKCYLVYNLDDESKSFWCNSLKQACSKAYSKSTPPMHAYMVAVTGLRCFAVNLDTPAEDEDLAVYYARCRAMMNALQ